MSYLGLGPTHARHDPGALFHGNKLVGRDRLEIFLQTTGPADFMSAIFSRPRPKCRRVSSTIPEPSLKIAATAWISAGGVQHTALSPDLASENLENFADMAGMEYLQWILSSQRTSTELRAEPLPADELPEQSRSSFRRVAWNCHSPERVGGSACPD